MRAFYFLSSCDSCKRILKELTLHDSIKRIDIKKHPLNKEQLDALYQLSGSYEALFSKRAQLYKQRNLKEQALSEADYEKLLLEHYTFLKRPVLQFDHQLFIGNSPKVVTAVKEFLDEQ
ncbi:MAG: ArsC/Spx/MgsR family protein [Flavobacteriaceae bacterium]